MERTAKRKSDQCWKPGGKCIGQGGPHTAAQQTNYGVCKGTTLSMHERHSFRPTDLLQESVDTAPDPLKQQSTSLD